MDDKPDKVAKPARAAPPNRASCDRCHAYKIRCARSNSDDSVSCARCSSLGARCVYSAPLPKGRPGGSRRSTSTTASSAALKRIPLLPQPQQPSPDLTDGQEAIAEHWPALEFPEVRCQAESWFQPYAWTLSDPMADEAASAHTATETHASYTSPAAFSGDDILASSMQHLATLSVGLYKLHNACRSASTTLQLRPQLISHTGAFSALATLLVDLPSLDGYEIFSEACLASKSLLQVMHRLRLFDPASDDAPVPPDATPGSSPLSGPMPTSEQSAAASRNAELQHMATRGHARGTLRVGPMVSTDSVDTNSAGRSFEPDAASQNDSAKQALRHLLSACYVQLLHVHTTLVGLMLHEALQAPGANQGDPFSFARMRLVVISNLVRHLVEHMRRGFATYAATMSRSDPDAMSRAGTHEIDQLERRLWVDLGQLQTCLSAGLQPPPVHFCSD